MRFLKKISTDTEAIANKYNSVYYSIESDKVFVIPPKEESYVIFTMYEPSGWVATASTINERLEDGSLTTIDLPYGQTTRIDGLNYGFRSLDSGKYDWESYGDIGVFPTNVDLSHYKPTNLTDMSHMFAAYGNGYTLLRATIDVSTLDTSKVTTMEACFAHSWALTSMDLSNWDMSNVTNTDYMFFKCYNLATLILPKSIKVLGYCFLAVQGETPSLSTLQYNGTVAEWNAIEKNDNWIYNRSKFAHLAYVKCTDGTVTI